MKTYEIKPEFWELWTNEELDSYTVTEEEVNRLAREWDIPKESLLDQLVEID